MFNKNDAVINCDYGLIVNNYIEGVVDPNKGFIYFKKDKDLLKNFCNNCNFSKNCTIPIRDGIYKTLI